MQSTFPIERRRWSQVAKVVFHKKTSLKCVSDCTVEAGVRLYLFETVQQLLQLLRVVSSVLTFPKKVWLLLTSLHTLFVKCCFREAFLRFKLLFFSRWKVTRTFPRQPFQKNKVRLVCWSCACMLEGRTSTILVLTTGATLGASNRKHTDCDRAKPLVLRASFLETKLTPKARSETSPWQAAIAH